MVTRVPSSGPAMGHVGVVPVSSSVLAQLFWVPGSPSCWKCAPGGQALYPQLNLLLSPHPARSGPAASTTEQCS